MHFVAALWVLRTTHAVQHTSALRSARMVWGIHVPEYDFLKNKTFPPLEAPIIGP